MGDTTYEGEFDDGEIEGVGLKRWPSSSGQFHQGEMYGEGVYLSANGEKYEGHWENSQRCGHGLRSSDSGPRCIPRLLAFCHDTYRRPLLGL
jgi:hypothetical protein